MKKEILFSFGLSSIVCAFAVFAHVHDAGHTHDYGEQYNHEKSEFDSKTHYDGEFFPDYNAWLGDQLEKEDQAKTLIDKGIAYVQQYLDPFTAGVDASTHITHENETRAPDRDSDQR